MNKLGRFLPFCLIAASLLTAVETDAQERLLNAGDNAPAFKVAKWQKGQPVERFELGKVYVVEFWATWCGPCKNMIPHLSALSKKYKGRAVFIGVAIDESDLAKVDTFVKGMGSKMDYDVCTEGADQYMNKNWPMAAQEHLIPTSFVIDGSRKIAWIGHPLGLDKVLGPILSGTWDVKAFAEKRARDKPIEAQRMADERALLAAFRANDFPSLVKLSEAALPKYPELRNELIDYHVVGLLHLNESRGYEAACQAFKLPDERDYLAESLSDDIVDIDNLSKQTYQLAVDRITLALKRHHGPNSAFSFNQLAKGYFRLGFVKLAIETQQQALKRMRVYPEEEKYRKIVVKEYEDRLAQYAAAARQG